jgi:hypothetical protein
MKRIYLILLLLPIIGLGSCVKQKNCDCGLTGIFEYSNEKIDLSDMGLWSSDKSDIHAIFTVENGNTYFIKGAIPKEYKQIKPISVSVCLDEYDGIRIADVGCVYPCKLKCIEKEN